MELEVSRPVPKPRQSLTREENNIHVTYHPEVLDVKFSLANKILNIEYCIDIGIGFRSLHYRQLEEHLQTLGTHNTKNVE